MRQGERMKDIEQEWPLSLGPEEAAVTALAALYVSAPFGGLDTEMAKATLSSPSFSAPLSTSIPDAGSLLASGQQWRLLERMALAVSVWTPERRDVVAIELVLRDSFVPDSAEVDPGLYRRRMDVALESLQSQFVASAVHELAREEANWLAQESKSGLKTVLTSEEVIDYGEILHRAQSSLTGVYIPFVADGLRWGQRKLDKVSDEALLLALASDVVRLKFRTSIGDVEAVRSYGQLLTEDIQEMSTRHAHGSSPDKRAKQIRLFTTVLAVVTECLGQDDDGLATSLSPGFDGMRLNEVRSLAQAMAVTLREEDGCHDGAEGSARSVYSASNWYVSAQRPSPGEPLGMRRLVRVWVVKHGESHLSSYQRLAYEGLSGEDPNNA
jgi:hypothetical protein